VATLKAEGWRVLLVWECALKGKYKRELADVLNEAEAFIRERRVSFAEIAEYGNTDGLAS